MSGSASDIAVNISCDPSELVTGMTVARDEIATTTTTIELQDQTWKRFAEGVLASVAKIVAPLLKLMTTYKQIQLATMGFAAANAYAVAPTFSLGVAVNFLMSPVVLITAALVACAAAVYFFSRSADDAAPPVEKAGRAAKETSAELSSLESTINSVTDSARNMFGDEIVGRIERLLRETSNFRSNLLDLKTAIQEPFTIGIETGGSFIATMIPAVRVIGDVNDVLSFMNKTMKEFTPTAGKASASIAAMLLSLSTGLPTADAEDIIGIGMSIKKQDAAIAKMEEQGEGFRAFRELQEEAAASSARNADVAKIASIVTLEGINSHVTALQERGQAVILAGDNDEDWTKQQSALFDALEKQRQGIINGTVVDKAATEAKKELAKAEVENQKTIKTALESVEKRHDDGEDRIRKLREEIELLNGTATKAEIAMREMARAGFTNDQVDEVGKLTEELDRLKKEEADAKKTDKPGKKGKDLSAAAQFGSSSAFSIIANASSGRDPVEKNTKVIADESKKTNKNLEKLVDAVGDFADVSVVELPA